MLGQAPASSAILNRNQENIMVNESLSHPQVTHFNLPPAQTWSWTPSEGGGSNFPDTHLCRWVPPWWWPACIYRNSWPSWMASAWSGGCGRPPARRAEERRGRKGDQEQVGWMHANRNTFGIQPWYILLWVHTGVWFLWWALMAFGFTWVFVILKVFLSFRLMNNGFG